MKPICVANGCDKIFTDTLEWISIPDRRDKLAIEMNTVPRVYNRVLLAIGCEGNKHMKLESFNPEEKKWSLIKSINYDYQYPCCTLSFFVNDHLYVLGRKVFDRFFKCQFNRSKSNSHNFFLHVFLIASEGQFGNWESH